LQGRKGKNREPEWVEKKAQPSMAVHGRLEEQRKEGCELVGFGEKRQREERRRQLGELHGR
jgi:ribosomal protein L37E